MANILFVAFTYYALCYNLGSLAVSIKTILPPLPWNISGLPIIDILIFSIAFEQHWGTKPFTSNTY